ncbi:hypothetical protein ASE37_21855 [Rhizobium sp. Root268]|nr:hypothetical protein ASC86_23285 [Rhizobium sp. Root1212]KRD35168.1 hypothetical protein ASE37_21855 [Rhizobium sp. Root268]
MPHYPATLAAGLFTVLAASPAPALEMCSGGNRAERKVTCIVDGDTGCQARVNWRLLDIDTPETDHAECSEEREIGKRAEEWEPPAAKV